MKDCWAYVFEQRQTFSFEKLLASLAAEGVTLKNPLSMLITKLTPNGLPRNPDDPSSGNQIETTQSDLATAIDRDERVPFQLWLDASHDIYCSVENLSPTVVEERFDLAGLKGQNLDRLYKALFTHFLSVLGTQTAIAFVADPTGVNEDFDWRQYLLKRNEPGPDRLPDILLLPQVAVANLRVDNVEHHSQRIGGFTLIVSKNSSLLQLTRSVMNTSQLPYFSTETLRPC